MKKWMPGLLLAAGIAVIAWRLGKLYPIVGGPVFGIVLGMIVATWRRPEMFEPGIRFTSKKILQLSIILLGFEMNLRSIILVGRQSLTVMFFTLAASFLMAWWVGKTLKIERNIATLIGVGTAICGGSAIAATAPVIQADDKEVAYSISTIFLFNVLAVFIFPAAGHFFQMNDAGFGMWAGTAINDTSSVVAAGYSYSDAAGDFATIVKLTRTLMIVPITLFLAVYMSRKRSSAGEFRFVKVFPWFVIGFLLASLLGTMGIVPPGAAGILSKAGKFLIVMAMAAIGLNTKLKNMVQSGPAPFLLGFCTWAAVAFTSLAVQHFMNIW
ncbi:MAG TPA: YeiH family putative sulfate export transporter [Clostridiales bacterium]|nr:YeiH family putative sulfate export transporter [Clostridiales bacterium]